jgi:hypothetical protein
MACHNSKTSAHETRYIFLGQVCGEVPGISCCAGVYQETARAQIDVDQR